MCVRVRTRIRGSSKLGVPLCLRVSRCECDTFACTALYADHRQACFCSCECVYACTDMSVPTGARWGRVWSVTVP